MSIIYIAPREDSIPPFLFCRIPETFRLLNPLIPFEKLGAFYKVEMTQFKKENAKSLCIICL